MIDFIKILCRRGTLKPAYLRSLKRRIARTGISQRTSEEKVFAAAKTFSSEPVRQHNNLRGIGLPAGLL
jgi:hypothetical protein